MIKTIAYGIVLLFCLSSVSPLVTGGSTSPWALEENEVRMAAAVLSEPTAERGEPLSSQSVLVVDAGGIMQSYYNTLNNIGQPYDMGIPASDLTTYDNVIWVEYLDAPNATERDNISSYLDGGGKLYINGEDIGYVLSLTAPVWYRDYLHAAYHGDDSNGTHLDGIPGDPITDGMAGLDLRPDGDVRWP
ncbi:MAG: hypothetical protein KAT70_09545, partial [Thermoplasmata archaeon]|nr:hypothetical protein [Thermoplasmata archaeon]